MSNGCNRNIFLHAQHSILRDDFPYISIQLLGNDICSFASVELRRLRPFPDAAKESGRHLISCYGHVCLCVCNAVVKKIEKTHEL